MKRPFTHVSHYRPQYRVIWSGSDWVAWCPLWPHIQAYHPKPHKALKQVFKMLRQQGLIVADGRAYDSIDDGTGNL